MSEKTSDFINNILDGNLVQAREDFNDVIASKLGDALDAERINVAASTYNEEYKCDDDKSDDKKKKKKSSEEDED